jgi:hypothetical protein
MKIKNEVLYSDITSDAMKELMETSMRGITSLKISKISKKLKELYIDLNNVIKTIRDKHCAKDEEGKPIYKKDEDGNDILDTILIKDVKAFTEEMNEVMSVENEIDVETIKIKELEDVNIKPKTLSILDWLIE